MSQRCKAKSKRTFKQCGQFVPPGAVVCRWHGGATTAAKEKAADRLRSLQTPALDAIEEILADKSASAQSPRSRLAVAVLDRTGLIPGVEVKTDHPGESFSVLISKMPVAKKRRLADLIRLRMLAESGARKLTRKETRELTALRSEALEGGTSVQQHGSSVLYIPSNSRERIEDTDKALLTAHDPLSLSLGNPSPESAE